MNYTLTKYTIVLDSEESREIIFESENRKAAIDAFADFALTKNKDGTKELRLIEKTYSCVSVTPLKVLIL